MKQKELKPYTSTIVLQVRHMATDDESAVDQRIRLAREAASAITDGVTVPDVLPTFGRTNFGTSKVQ